MGILTVYILSSIAVFYLLKGLRYEMPVLAIVPFYREYLVAKIYSEKLGDKEKEKTFFFRIFTLVLLSLFILVEALINNYNVFEIVQSYYFSNDIFVYGLIPIVFNILVLVIFSAPIFPILFENHYKKLFYSLFGILVVSQFSIQFISLEILPFEIFGRILYVSKFYLCLVYIFLAIIITVKFENKVNANSYKLVTNNKKFKLEK